MAKIWEIYVITCASTGKVYVGQTSKGIQRRWTQHVSEGGCTKLDRALTKYGSENFTIESVICTKNPEDACALEAEFIAQYDSVGKGFNILHGTGGVPKAYERFCKRGHDTIEGRTRFGACIQCEKDRRRARYLKQQADPVARAAKNAVHREYCNKMRDPNSSVDEEQRAKFYAQIRSSVSKHYRNVIKNDPDKLKLHRKRGDLWRKNKRSKS